LSHVNVSNHKTNSSYNFFLELPDILSHIYLYIKYFTITVTSLFFKLSSFFYSLFKSNSRAQYDIYVLYLFLLERQSGYRWSPNEQFSAVSWREQVTFH